MTLTKASSNVLMDSWPSFWTCGQLLQRVFINWHANSSAISYMYRENICWIIYQDASFKICLSLFGWKVNILPKMHIFPVARGDFWSPPMRSWWPKRLSTPALTGTSTRCVGRKENKENVVFATAHCLSQRRGADVGGARQGAQLLFEDDPTCRPSHTRPAAQGGGKDWGVEQALRHPGGQARWVSSRFQLSEWAGKLSCLRFPQRLSEERHVGSSFQFQLLGLDYPSLESFKRYHWNYQLARLSNLAL